jgi:hypothetical protein
MALLIIVLNHLAVCEGMNMLILKFKIKYTNKCMVCTPNNSNYGCISAVLFSVIHFYFSKSMIINVGVLTDNLDATEIPDHSNVQRVASLLGVPKQPLIDALTQKTIFASGETVVS